jgi:hypothetical protein
MAGVDPVLLGKVVGVHREQVVTGQGPPGVELRDARQHQALLVERRLVAGLDQGVRLGDGQA